MRAGTVAVFGASGVVGRAAARQLSATGWEVLGLSRRPGVEPGVQAVPIDLKDRDRCRRGDPALKEVTHVVYAALHEEDHLVQGWADQQHADTNVAMLDAALDLLAASGADLRRLVVLQGTKAYTGYFEGGLPVPARERWPWRPSVNFYQPQQELLRRRLPDADVTYLRPQVVFGEATGSNMNIVPALGAYAALLRARSEALHYPGGADVVTQAVDASLLARAVAWSLSTPAAVGQTFNITNGEAFSLRHCWPTIAAALGMEVGENRPCRTADALKGAGDEWRELARRFVLCEPDLGAVVGRSLQYLDLYSGVGAIEQPPPTLVSTVKVRQAGFADCVDTEEMLTRQLTALQDRRVLPPKHWRQEN